MKARYLAVITACSIGCASNLPKQTTTVEIANALEKQVTALSEAAPLSDHDLTGRFAWRLRDCVETIQLEKYSLPKRESQKLAQILAQTSSSLETYRQAIIEQTKACEQPFIGDAFPRVCVPAIQRLKLAEVDLLKNDRQMRDLCPYNPHR